MTGLSNILIAFSRRENAVNIRNILVKSGIEVTAVCQTGSKVLQYAEMWNEGLVICGCRLQDMQYSELREMLPDGIELLLIAPADRWINALPSGVVGLSLPVRAYDLVSTAEMILGAQEAARRRRRSQRKVRSESEQKTVDQAKALLMERNSMSEAEAHRYLQKTSMESGTGLTETAQMILTIMKE